MSLICLRPSQHLGLSNFLLANYFNLNQDLTSNNFTINCWLSWMLSLLHTNDSVVYYFSIIRAVYFILGHNIFTNISIVGPSMYSHFLHFIKDRKTYVFLKRDKFPFPLNGISRCYTTRIVFESRVINLEVVE